jgi:hypothetical protein
MEEIRFLDFFFFLENSFLKSGPVHTPYPPPGERGMVSSESQRFFNTASVLELCSGLMEGGNLGNSGPVCCLGRCLLSGTLAAWRNGFVDAIRAS